MIKLVHRQPPFDQYYNSLKKLFFIILANFIFYNDKWKQSKKQNNIEKSIKRKELKLEENKLLIRMPFLYCKKVQAGQSYQQPSMEFIR
jgi:hypothetical protein